MLKTLLFNLKMFFPVTGAIFLFCILLIIYAVIDIICIGTEILQEKFTYFRGGIDVISTKLLKWLDKQMGMENAG